MERQRALKKNQAKWRGCVKKPYDTEQEVAKERFVLVAAEHKNFFGKAIKWGYEFCDECKAFHITREI